MGIAVPRLTCHGTRNSLHTVMLLRCVAEGTVEFLFLLLNTCKFAFCALSADAAGTAVMC